MQYFKIINIYTFKEITHHHVSDDLKLYYTDFNDHHVHPSHEHVSVSHSQNLGPSPLSQVKHLTNWNCSVVSALSSLTAAWCKNTHSEHALLSMRSWSPQERVSKAMDQSSNFSIMSTAVEFFVFLHYRQVIPYFYSITKVLVEILRTLTF